MQSTPSSYERPVIDGVVNGTLGKVRMFTSRQHLMPMSRDGESLEYHNNITKFEVLIDDGSAMLRDERGEKHPVFSKHWLETRGPITEKITLVEGPTETDWELLPEKDDTKVDGNTQITGISRFFPNPMKLFSAPVKEADTQKARSTGSTCTTFYKGGTADKPRWTLTFDPYDQGGYPNGAKKQSFGDGTEWSGTAHYTLNTNQSKEPTFVPSEFADHSLKARFEEVLRPGIA